MFLSEDEHYLASSKAYGDRGFQGLNDALDLFLEQPELGFVWMAYDEDGVAGSLRCLLRDLDFDGRGGGKARRRFSEGGSARHRDRHRAAGTTERATEKGSGDAN